MKKMIFLLLPMVAISLIYSCKKDIKEQVKPPEKMDSLPANVSKVIQVIFPQNTNIDLATCEVSNL